MYVLSLVQVVSSSTSVLVDAPALLSPLSPLCRPRAQANLRHESVKSLKKLNLDIQSQCEEGELGGNEDNHYIM